MVLNTHKAFRYERQGATLIVSLMGDCLNTEESALEREIDALHKVFDDPGMKNIVIDIGSLPFFGSIIIGAIMALCHRAIAGGGKAVLCDASEGMRDVLRIMKLDTVLPYFNTREEALASVGG